MISNSLPLTLLIGFLGKLDASSARYMIDLRSICGSRVAGQLAA